MALKFNSLGQCVMTYYSVYFLLKHSDKIFKDVLTKDQIEKFKNLLRKEYHIESGSL